MGPYILRFQIYISYYEFYFQLQQVCCISLVIMYTTFNTKEVLRVSHTHTVTAVFIGKMIKHLYFIVKDKLYYTVKRNAIITDS